MATPRKSAPKKSKRAVKQPAAQAAPSTTDEQEMLSFDEAVRFLGTSKPTLYRLLQQETIKGLKVGRQWRFRKADLIAHMERKPATVSLAATAEIQTAIDFFADELGRSGVKASGDIRDDSTPSEERQTIFLVNGILQLAIERGASDIHVEPT